MNPQTPSTKSKGFRCQEVKAKKLKPQSLLNTETLVIVIYVLLSVISCGLKCSPP